MKNWIFGIILALLCAGHAHAASMVFPAIFDGLTVTPDMIKTVPGKDGAVLVALKITVPPNAPPTASPMDGYREDMWKSGQLRTDKHLVAATTTLTAEQSYKTLFCLINKDALGFACKSTAEIMAASKTKPWLIPIAVVPEKVVGEFTAFLTKAPIVVPEARVAVSGQTSRTPHPGALLPWSDGAGSISRTAPAGMQWFEGVPPAGISPPKFPPAKSPVRSGTVQTQAKR